MHDFLSVSLTITIQPRFNILGPHIDNGIYMSSGHVSPDIDLNFMVY